MANFALFVSKTMLPFAARLSYSCRVEPSAFLHFSAITRVVSLNGIESPNFLRISELNIAYPWVLRLLTTPIPPPD